MHNRRGHSNSKLSCSLRHRICSKYGLVLFSYGTVKHCQISRILTTLARPGFKFGMYARLIRKSSASLPPPPKTVRGFQILLQAHIRRKYGQGKSMRSTTYALNRPNSFTSPYFPQIRSRKKHARHYIRAKQAKFFYKPIFAANTVKEKACAALHTL